MTKITQSSPDIADITMQDVRLVCGEGKLENRHVLNAVNVIIKRRAEMATPSVPASVREALERFAERADILPTGEVMMAGIDIVDRLRFDATRCETAFSKGVASNIEEAIREIERLRGVAQVERTEVGNDDER